MNEVLVALPNAYKIFKLSIRLFLNKYFGNQMTTNVASLISIMKVSIKL